jgi:hypothetical protein
MFSRKRSARVKQPCIFSGSAFRAASVLLASRYVGLFLSMRGSPGLLNQYGRVRFDWRLSKVSATPMQSWPIWKQAQPRFARAPSSESILISTLRPRYCSAPTQISTSPLRAFGRPAKGRSILPLIYGTLIPG